MPIKKNAPIKNSAPRDVEVTRDLISAVSGVTLNAKTKAKIFKLIDNGTNEIVALEVSVNAGRLPIVYLALSTAAQAAKALEDAQAPIDTLRESQTPAENPDYDPENRDDSHFTTEPRLDK